MAAALLKKRGGAVMRASIPGPLASIFLLVFLLRSDRNPNCGLTFSQIVLFHVFIINRSMSIYKHVKQNNSRKQFIRGGSRLPRSENRFGSDFMTGLNSPKMDLEWTSTSSPFVKPVYRILSTFLLPQFNEIFYTASSHQ